MTKWYRPLLSTFCEVREGVFIEFKHIASGDYEKVYEYMLRDFPSPGELAPFFAIKHNLESGRYEGYFLYVGNTEAGYMIMTAPENSRLVFGNYFAIHPELRAKGYGSAFLDSIIDKYRDRTIVIEVSDPTSSNKKTPSETETDFKRIAFYKRAGFAVAPTIKCRIYGADMLIMATNLYNGFSAREAMLSLYDHPSAAGNIDIIDANNRFTVDSNG